MRVWGIGIDTFQSKEIDWSVNSVHSLKGEKAMNETEKAKLEKFIAKKHEQNRIEKKEFKFWKRAGIRGLRSNWQWSVSKTLGTDNPTRQE